MKKRKKEISINQPFDCEFSIMKEVLDGVLYHATQITLRIIIDIVSKNVIIKVTAPISKSCM